MKTLVTPIFSLAFVLPALALAFFKEPAVSSPDRDLHFLEMMIRPQSGESPWREIAWLTDVTEARRRSIAEDKPLVIFTAADGSPLGRT